MGEGEGRNKHEHHASMNMIDLLSHNLLIGVVGFHCTHRCTVDGVDIDEYKPSAVHSSLGRNE